MLNVAKEVFNMEIDELKNVCSRLDDNFIEAVEAIYHAKNGRIIVSGIGKSGNIGKKIAATLSSTGTPALFLHPVEALHGDLGIVNYEDIFLILSNSGETEELIKLVVNIKRFGGFIIGFIGRKDSSLANASDIVIDVEIKQEACPLGLAPTSSTTAMLVMGDALAVTLLKKRKFSKKDYAFFHPGGSLGRKLLFTIEDLMHSGDAVPKVNMKMKMKDVFFVISEKRLGLATVVGSDGVFLGLITDGDLRRLIEKYGNELLDKIVEEVMNKKASVVKSNMLASRALEIMESKKITALPVVEENGVVIGIIHIHDILEAKIV